MIEKAERDEATGVVDFWFGAPSSGTRFQPRAVWFRIDPEFDGQIRGRFLALQIRAAQGKCADWALEAEPALALVLLLDQFPRNLYRGTREAFATDPLARAAADAALARGFDRSLPATWRQFLYLPFMHSENPADQERSLALYRALGGDKSFAGTLDFAQRHHAIVARFGRFPHRNALLGRVSSVAEEEFLKEPNSSL